MRDESLGGFYQSEIDTAESRNQSGKKKKKERDSFQVFSATPQQAPSVSLYTSGQCFHFERLDRHTQKKKVFKIMFNRFK